MMLLNQKSKVKSPVTSLIRLICGNAPILVLSSPQLTRMQRLIILLHLKMPTIMFHLKMFLGVPHELANLLHDSEVCLCVTYVFNCYTCYALFFGGGDCGNLRTILQSALQLVWAAQFACTCFAAFVARCSCDWKLTLEMATAQRTRLRAVVCALRCAAWQPKSALRNSVSAAPRTIIFYIFLFQLLLMNYFFTYNNG